MWRLFVASIQCRRARRRLFQVIVLLASYAAPLDLRLALRLSSLPSKLLEAGTVFFGSPERTHPLP